MSWTRNNAAHSSAWATNRALYEMPMGVSFKDAESYEVDDLRFYVKSATEQQRKSAAKALAGRYDRIHRVLLRTKYEEGWRSSTAVKAMTDLLLDASKTVGDLGRKMDDIYLFLGE